MTSRRSRPAAIGADAAFGSVATAALASHFAALLAKEPGTRRGEDPEDLHSMRTAGRRLREALRFFRDALPPRARRLRDDLAWIGAALGAVRDLDVQAARLAAWTSGDRRLLAAVADTSMRESARRRLLAALGSQRWRRLVRDFETMLAAAPSLRRRAAEVPVAAAAPPLVRELRRRFEKAARRARRAPSPESLHAVRIRARRLRYALELLAPVYGDAAAKLARRFAGVQDHLGRHQDACVAADRLERRLAAGNALPPGPAAAMAALAARCRDEAADLRAAFPKVCSRTRGRPWHRFRRRMRALVPPGAT